MGVMVSVDIGVVANSGIRMKACPNGHPADGQPCVAYKCEQEVDGVRTLERIPGSRVSVEGDTSTAGSDQQQQGEFPTDEGEASSDEGEASSDEEEAELSIGHSKR